MTEVELTGCAPEPLMGYLKALGVFRLVGEQADREARGFWRSGSFVIESKLDREGLKQFLLEEYKPSPVLGPWGARSGFYPGSSESSAREALNSIVAAGDRQLRLVPLRDMIVGVRDLLNRLGFTEKVQDEDKLTLMRACRNELPDSILPWLDAVFILTDDSRKFPPLLGTGGNEGSGSYVSTFAQVVDSLLVRRECDGGVLTALYGGFDSPLGGLAVGHFNPGAIGGANSSQGFHGGGGVNQWDYLLAVEGCLLFAGSAARRLGDDTDGRAGFPFCVEAVAVGYPSGSDKEAGESTRAELWLPTWPRPMTLPELSQLLAEGRAQLGRQQARNAVEFALAACTLGVSHGIDAFIRYAFVMRNGLSYFASPLGRVPVTSRPEARLLDDPPLSRWINGLRIACRDKDKTPSRFQSALRNIDRAVYDFATRAQTDPTADRRALLDVLLAIGRAERTLAEGLAFCNEERIHPLNGLSVQWLIQAAPHGDDGQEFRLAAALASVVAEKGRPVGPIRTHLEEVEQQWERVKWKPGSTSAAWSNRPLADNLGRILLRRWLESERAGVQGVGLRARVFAPLADVVAFLNRQTDDELLTDLLWALIGLKWSEGEFSQRQFREDLARVFRVPVPVPPPHEFGLIRLLLCPVHLVSEPARRSGLQWRATRELAAGGLVTTPSPEPFRQLSYGNGPAAVTLAARRLWSDRLVPFGWANRQRRSGEYPTDSAFDPVRLLAACLFPLSLHSLTRLARQVLDAPVPAN